MIVVIIGIIALIITFFLLLVSTSHNIKDSIWEYGVLRSMGVTKTEGSRIYMYEAFLVITSAGVLGCIIGLIVSTLVTVFFNVFLEQPFILNFPLFFILSLVLVALTTTYFAVYFPLR
jgi:ABC-type antimicrobial peptide transport system permease subunit